MGLAPSQYPVRDGVPAGRREVDPVSRLRLGNPRILDPNDQANGLGRRQDITQLGQCGGNVLEVRLACRSALISFIISM